MRWLLLFCAAAFASCTTYPGGLKDFQSDGCSVFPDGTLNHPQKWQAHCVKHDLAYWQGGTHEQRREADRKLVRAVRAEGHPLLARCMYSGMRIGGAPWWPTPWRWGFGWSYPRGYGELSPDEERQVNERCAAMKSVSSTPVSRLPNDHK